MNRSIETRLQQALFGPSPGGMSLAVRAGCRAATPLYRAAVALRNKSYERGWKQSLSAPVPVISVGNITTGGTGKTPMAAWIVQTLTRMGRRPALLSRGYRSLNGEENDEKRLLDSLCPGIPHVQNPDRVAGARTAAGEHGCDVIVLDDGFQHRRLRRDLDIVLIDAVNPWGHGALLPRGLLREPITSLRRADFVCLTRVDQCDAASLEAIRLRIQQQTPAPIGEASFVPSGLVDHTGGVRGLNELQRKSIGAFCGIGNPAGFFGALSRITALESGVTRTFPDHWHYTPDDVASLAAWAEQHRFALLVTTRKDLVKLPYSTIGPAALLALDIGVEWRSGEEKLTALLQRAVAAGGLTGSASRRRS